MILKVENHVVGGWTYIDDVAQADVSHDGKYHLYVEGLDGPPDLPKCISIRECTGVEKRLTSKKSKKGSAIEIERQWKKVEGRLFDEQFYPDKLFIDEAEDRSYPVYLIILKMRDGSTRSIGVCMAQAFLLNDKGDTINRLI